MQIVIAIDDTDNLESRGTGALASLLAEALEEKGWGESQFITRHQLLVHPDVPYTSHNSSMCFTARIDETCLDSIINYATDFLARESASGSDPGLCVAVVDRLTDREKLLAFGRMAKQEVISMSAAYEVAAQVGCHLSAHGGNGQGVIGALAGIGLRLGGNDGRLKGSLQIPAKSGRTTVAELQRQARIDEVRSFDGQLLNDDDQVLLGDKVKTVLLDGKSVLLLEPLAGSNAGAPWQTCSKQRLKSY